MTLLYYDSVFLQHETGGHPECAERLLPFVGRLDDGQVDTWELCSDFPAASLKQVCRVHERNYVESVQQFAAGGGGQIEADTVVSPRSFDVALRAAGAVCSAIERVIAGADNNAFCLVRPPGHHALPDRPMGFCLLNNIAIGAALARDELGVDQVLIVDFDVHHGNGTQDTFWTDASIGFLSMHRWPFYPGSGAADETGSGAGLGTTRNLPIEFGTSPHEQVKLFDQNLTDFAEQIRPQLVMVSAGFDSHKDDPIGSLGLDSEDFAALTRSIQNVAETHADGRIVSVLEGGYNPHALADSLTAHLNQLAAG